MRILMSPFYYVRTKRARRTQVCKALQMLSVSGVVRPSHIEPRYFEGATQVDALYRQEARPIIIAHATASQTWSWQRDVKIDLARIRQWVGAFRPARLQVGQ